MEQLGKRLGCAIPSRMESGRPDMFGIGIWEMAILGAICCVPVLAGAVVLIVLLLNKKSSSDPQEHTDAQS